MSNIQAIQSVMCRVSCEGEEHIVPKGEAWELGGRLFAKHGKAPTFEDIPAAPASVRAPDATPAVQLVPNVAEVSTWETQVTDDAAKSRIQSVQDALNSAGVRVNAGEQLYATGTRMAVDGYATQHGRKREHDKQALVSEVAHELVTTIAAERRTEVQVTARELAQSLQCERKITAMGYTLSEQAIRGLFARIDQGLQSCGGMPYIIGLRNRIAAEVAKGGDGNREQIARDKQRIAEVIHHECMRAGDTVLQLRAREANGDIFAVVSPEYTIADAPHVLGSILSKLPSQAKGSFSYDPTSTAWELRASVWTPTPVDQQAVGEPFEGYVSWQSRDNGTSGLLGGGGATMLRCLNASTYVAMSGRSRRTHRGEVMYDIDTMLAESMVAITTLCDAWGLARESVISLPEKITVKVNRATKERAPTLEEAIPGFYRHLLTAKSSQLAHVLSGRSEVHVQGLSRAYLSERRDTSRIVRADLAQGWTRYIQDLPKAEERRAAEVAIGDWVVNNRKPVLCDMAGVS